MQLDWSRIQIALVNFTVGSYIWIESIGNCNFNYHSEFFKLVMIFKLSIEVFLIKVFPIVIVLLVFKFIFCCT